MNKADNKTALVFEKKSGYPSLWFSAKSNAVHIYGRLKQTITYISIDIITVSSLKSHGHHCK